MSRNHLPRLNVLFLLSLLLQAAASGAEAPQATNEPIAVTIRVDVAQTKGALKSIWRFFGADEPNYAYMKDGRKLIQELGELKPQEVYFRAHSLLVSGDGTPALKWGSTGAYREDAQGRPVYNWTLVDRIFETYLERGVKPYVQIGFMPKEMSIKPEPYQHQWTPKAKYDDIYTGWAYPPKDYAKWAELVYQWARHSVEKYGRTEVDKWYWEVWNEPNIGYWRGTPQEFQKLHDYAIDAVRRALPTARVGGPDVAGGPGGTFLTNFLEHCVRGTNYATGKIGTPVDFISFHAKGSPSFVDGHVRMGIANQLRNINDAFGVVARFPELKDKPIVIGESDPDGCAACQGPQLGYRNGTMYSSYTAASFARKHELADRHGVNLEGALTWAFEFEDQPFFAGFRVLASNGIDLPVLNVFRMFSRMRGQRLAVESDGAVPLEAILRGGVRGQPDVSALASFETNKIWVMAWHYHDDDVAGPDANVDVAFNNLPTRGDHLRIRQFRIDERHTNPWALWKAMGSPAQPTDVQYGKLAEAGHLRESAEPIDLDTTGGTTKARLILPRHGIALLELEWD